MRTPTDDDRRHLVQAMKDIADGWKLHPFTCTQFEMFGWLDDHGWTQAAYDAKRAAVSAPPADQP